VSAADIDKIGLSSALRLAARRAYGQIDNEAVDQIIIDGTSALIDDPRVTLMKKADLLVPSVSAASIIAKVARDSYMSLCDSVFPGYGFSGHVGYGAQKHRIAIETLGVLPIHRASFAPIAKLIATENNIIQHMKKNVDITSSVMDSSPTSVGSRAELIASDYLKNIGFQIIDRNWRSKWCEIDIVAKKGDCMYFVEVKYRRSLEQGGGLAAITLKKQKQMKFAAEFWLHNRPEINATLSAIEVTGENYNITSWIERV